MKSIIVSFIDTDEILPWSIDYLNNVLPMCIDMYWYERDCNLCRQINVLLLEHFDITEEEFLDNYELGLL